jgi:hypothetical protein
MKLTNQMVALVLGTLAGMVVLVVSLAIWADWSDGAIVGMVSAFGTVAGGIIVAVRNQQKTAEVLAGQDEKLEKIDHQTNGLSAAEREDIARRAAAAAIEQARREGVL